MYRHDHTYNNKRVIVIVFWICHVSRSVSVFPTAEKSPGRHDNNTFWIAHLMEFVILFGF